MPNIVLSPNMSLPVPVVGVDPGPDWASNINSSLGLVDSHDHSPGKGVQITPSGLNLNSDLSFLNNNAISLKSSRFSPQLASLVGASDVGCIYVIGLDLYYNDVNGNVIRITQGGSIVGASGSIANLVSPASATFNAGTETIVFQANTNKPANLDFGFAILRNNVTNSFGLTLSPPSAMSGDYTLTLPRLPSQTNIVTLDSSGNFSAVTNVDNTTIQIAANNLKVKDHSIGPTQLANLNYSLASLSGNFTLGVLSTDVLITNQTVTVTTTGRPVQLGFQMPANLVSTNQFFVTNSGGVIFKWKRNGTEISNAVIVAATSNSFGIVPGMLSTLDIVGAGTYTYELYVNASSGSFTSGVTITGGVGIQILAYEI